MGHSKNAKSKALRQGKSPSALVSRNDIANYQRKQRRKKGTKK